MENHNENNKPASSAVGGKVRVPLGTIQKTGGSLSENEMVGRKPAPIQPKKSVGEGLTKAEKDKWAGRIRKPSSNNRPKKSGLGGKSKTEAIDRAIQTWATGFEREPCVEYPPAYWRELAETRASALEETLMENAYLHKRIEELEADNLELENLMKEAKNLADMVQLLDDADELNDEETNEGDQDSGMSSAE